VSAPAATAATHDELHELLALTVGHLLRELHEGAPSAAMLDVARKLLKDNGVQLTPAQARAPREALALLDAMQSIPFPGNEDEEDDQ
jgi:hypothetical protein